MSVAKKSDKLIGKTTSRISSAAKIATVAGAAVAMLQGSADADVVIVDDRPVSLSAGFNTAFATWDIDGNGTDEWRLVNLPALGVSSTTYGSQFIPLNIMFESVDPGGSINGGVIGTGANNALGLNTGFIVGPSAGGNMWATAQPYSFQMLRARAFGNYQSTSSGGSTFVVTGYGGTEVGQNLVDFQIGANFLGFRFDSGGDTHYGWANVILDNGAVTIDRWAYESTANTPIQITGVPEPGSLGLLALGAAGLLALRRKKNHGLA